MDKDLIRQRLSSVLSWLKQKWWIPALVLAGLLVVSLSLREEQLEAKTVAVRQGHIRQYILEEGTTALENEYHLSMPLNGRIARIDFHPGDSVEAGQALARVNAFTRQQELQGLQARMGEIEAQRRNVDVALPKAEDYATARSQIAAGRHQLQQLQLQREQAEIELQSQRKELERQQQLFQAQVIDPARFDNYQKAEKLAHKQLAQVIEQEKGAAQTLRQAQLALQKLEASQQDTYYQKQALRAQQSQLVAQLKVKQDELHQSQLASPIAGTILDVLHPHAGPVAAGTVLLSVGDLKQIHINADVLSEEVHQLQREQPVEISGKALAGESIMGKISRIYPSGFTKLSALGVEQQRIKLEVSFDNQNVQLLPGTRVDLKLITAQKQQTLIIPERALFKEAGQWQVFKLDAEDKAQLQVVKVGLKNDDDAEILSGLQAGDRIIEERVNALKAGVKIVAPK